MPDFFCFNTDRREHARLYGVAFYDLELDDRRLKTADGLTPGDECLVATPTRDGGTIEFGWFSFLHQREMPDPDKPTTNVRVLFGKRTKSETLSRADAMQREPYSEFFKTDGSESFKVGITVMKRKD